MELGNLIKKSEANTLIYKRGYFNFRSSHLGRCHRSLQYSVMRIKSEEAPEKTKVMWEERLQDEERIVRKLKKKYNIKCTGEDQLIHYRILKDSERKVILSSTPDGLVEDKGEWIPLEIKSLNPFRFAAIKGAEGLSREYFVQIQTEMLLTGTKKALYVIGNSKFKEEKVNKFFVSLDDRILPWLDLRIGYILSFIKKGHVIYPEYYPGSEKCRWCLYKERCKKDFVYKSFNLKYNGIVKIDKDDFEYGRIEELSKRIIASEGQLEDLKFELDRDAHELKDLFLKRKVGKFKHAKTDLNSVNRILGGR